MANSIFNEVKVHSITTVFVYDEEPSTSKRKRPSSSQWYELPAKRFNIHVWSSTISWKLMSTFFVKLLLVRWWYRYIHSFHQFSIQSKWFKKFSVSCLSLKSIRLAKTKIKTTKMNSVEKPTKKKQKRVEASVNPPIYPTVRRLRLVLVWMDVFLLLFSQKKQKTLCSCSLAKNEKRKKNCKIQKQSRESVQMHLNHL